MQSVWTAWKDNPPEWITANPWTWEIYDSLADASAIAPTILGVKQFDTARPEWHKYLTGEVAGRQDGGDQRDERGAR